MKKLAEWRIKTKKDWILAFLFTALMVYVAAVRFFTGRSSILCRSSCRIR